MSTAERPAHKALSWLSHLAQTPTTPHEALALFTHALLLGHGFRSTNTSTASSTGTNAADPSAHTPTLPTNWGVGGWGGRYRHDRSSLTFDIRMTAIAGRFIINAASIETEAESRRADDGQVRRLEVKVGEFVDVDTNGDLKEFTDSTQSTSEEEKKDKWKKTLKGEENYATLVQVNISHRLVPDAAKAGYEEAAASSASTSEAGSSRLRAGRPVDTPSPIPMPGPRPVPPVADDPLRIGGPMRPRMPQGVGVGYDDLHPAGLPQPGALRPPGMGGFNDGTGGMLVGPNHPMFAGRGGNGGVRGGRGRVPPGARFDPFGPGVPPDDIHGQGPPDFSTFNPNPDIMRPPRSDDFM